MAEMIQIIISSFAARVFARRSPADEPTVAQMAGGS